MATTNRENHRHADRKALCLKNVLRELMETEIGQHRTEKDAHAEH